ncbi:hypothetical protein C8J35_103496 [Rhizobium sp. PP-F2F-G38]|nr:hypothetical protein C8J35_103496 [Rhizobium sp. PP-F2F-G38]
MQRELARSGICKAVTALQILAIQVQAQRMAFMTLTGAATFAAILATAHIAEGQQARQDLLMQKMRGPILSSPALGSAKVEGVKP